MGRAITGDYPKSTSRSEGRHKRGRNTIMFKRSSGKRKTLMTIRKNRFVKEGKLKRGGYS